MLAALEVGRATDDVERARTGLHRHQAYAVRAFNRLDVVDAHDHHVGQTLADAFDIKFVFNKWTLGEEFCTNMLKLDADAYRLVHGEADLLPSLVVDGYAGYLVVQALSQGMDALLPVVTAALVEQLQPAGILARNDPKVRTLEGLAQTVEVLHGTVPETVRVREGAVNYDVDLWKGQKTGLFLDQRENREAAARYAHGRLLDAFSYNGGFALSLAPQCTSVDALDISADAVARITRNAAANARPNVHAREANVFDELRRLERAGERFDTIVLDPPAFAKNKASITNARAGYKEINLRALKLLNAGGTLVTCSCSYNINEAAFAEIVYEAAVDAQADRHRAGLVDEYALHDAEIKRAAAGGAQAEQLIMAEAGGRIGAPAHAENARAAVVDDLPGFQRAAALRQQRLLGAFADAAEELHVLLFALRQLRAGLAERAAGQVIMHGGDRHRHHHFQRRRITLFDAAGVRPGDTVVAYCHIGQQATTVIFAGRTLGLDVKLYDGSFEEWSKKNGAVEKTIIK